MLIKDLQFKVDLVFTYYLVVTYLREITIKCEFRVFATLSSKKACNVLRKGFDMQTEVRTCLGIEEPTSEGGWNTWGGGLAPGARFPPYPENPGFPRPRYRFAASIPSVVYSITQSNSTSR